MNQTKKCFRNGKWNVDELANLCEKFEHELDRLILINRHWENKECIRKHFKTSRHFHVNNSENDTCKECGKDLRDEIHFRVNEVE